jgi:hypothetical protein
LPDEEVIAERERRDERERVRFDRPRVRIHAATLVPQTRA